MDVRIGIKDSGRELAFETNQSSADIEQIVSTALNSGDKIVTFADSKGRKFVVPSASIAYLEIGVEEASRVGFIA
jgi:translation initiation factor 2B subunit (eIF-2B alpha/beta/delta family)